LVVDNDDYCFSPTVDLLGVQAILQINTIVVVGKGWGMGLMSSSITMIHCLSSDAKLVDIAQPYDIPKINIFLAIYSGSETPK